MDFSWFSMLRTVLLLLFIELERLGLLLLLSIMKFSSRLVVISPSDALLLLDLGVSKLSPEIEIENDFEFEPAFFFLDPPPPLQSLPP